MTDTPPIPDKLVSLVDVKFNPDSRPRGKLKQYGILGNNIFTARLHQRPFLERLKEYEQIALYDTTVNYVLFVLIDTLLSMLNPIEHPDPEIQEFLRKNIDMMGGLLPTDNPNGDRYVATSSQLYESLFRILYSTMWAGYSTTEVLYRVESGQLLIEDFLSYHPATILIRPNRRGRLVEGEIAYDMRPTGIYQLTGQLNSMYPGESQLPLWKVVQLSRQGMHGNHYGISAMEQIYKWHLLKEAFIDMQAVALDRSGTPIVAITVPIYNTNQIEIDPVTGEERQMTTQEILERQIQMQNFGGGGNIILLPQIDSSMQPKIQVLSNGSSVGEHFEIAIERCDREIAKGLLTPYILLFPSAKGENVRDTQRPMELFNRIVISLYKQFIIPTVTQSFHRLIKLNFTRESAKIAPRFPLRGATRPEDRVALMQMISGLTDRGYFNPMEPVDWAMVREMVDAANRTQTSGDQDFIHQMIIMPKLPVPTEGDSGGDGKKRDGTVRGKGVKAGRPKGTSAPKTTIQDPTRLGS
jgi:hypothetical protein